MLLLSPAALARLMARAGPQTNAGVRSMMMSNLETLLVSPAIALSPETHSETPPSFSPSPWLYSAPRSRPSPSPTPSPYAFAPPPSPLTCTPTHTNMIVVASRSSLTVSVRTMFYDHAYLLTR